MLTYLKPTYLADLVIEKLTDGACTSTSVASAQVHVTSDLTTHENCDSLLES